MAAIILIGNSVKTLLNNNADITKAVKAANHWEYLEVAHDLIFNAVLTNTAVAGIPPINPDQIFAIALPKISLSLLNQTLVIFSPIFPEIIVSNMVTIAITADIFTMSVIAFVLERSAFVFCIYEKSRNQNDRFGYLLLSNAILGNHH
ncbi:TPA: hypothetical protein DIC40_07705 [Patescibacteria group bacterium]|nr:hypothetical protein [Candidatus Gracilibacteria bacterium]